METKMDWAKQAEIASKELLKPNIRPLEIKKGWCKGKFDYKPIRGLAPIGTPYVTSGIFDHIICDDVEQPKPFTKEEWKAWCKHFAKVPQHGFSEETLKMFEHKEAVANMLMFGDYPGAILGRWTWFDAIRGFFYKILERLRRPRMFSKSIYTKSERKEMKMKDWVEERIKKHETDYHSELLGCEQVIRKGEVGSLGITLDRLLNLIFKHLGITLKTTPETTELVSVVKKKKRMRKAVGKSKDKK